MGRYIVTLKRGKTSVSRHFNYKRTANKYKTYVKKKLPKGVKISMYKKKNGGN